MRLAGIGLSGETILHDREDVINHVLDAVENAMDQHGPFKVVIVDSNGVDEISYATVTGSGEKAVMTTMAFNGATSREGCEDIDFSVLYDQLTQGLDLTYVRTDGDERYISVSRDDLHPLQIDSIVGFDDE